MCLQTSENWNAYNNIVKVSVLIALRLIEREIYNDIFRKLSYHNITFCFWIIQVNRASNCIVKEVLLNNHTHNIHRRHVNEE